MDFEEEGSSRIPHCSPSPFFTPFAPESIILISSTTHSGKSTLLKNIIVNRDSCFLGQPVTKVLVVICNERVSGANYLELNSEHLQVDIVYLETFNPETDLEENLLLIFDDCQRLTPLIKECLNIDGHHQKLKSVFIVVQAAVDSKTFMNLLSLVHFLIVFFSGTSAVKLFKNIKKEYFASEESKQFVQEIINFGERERNTSLFELNHLKGKTSTYFSAISGIDNLPNFKFSTGGPVVIYPRSDTVTMYQEEFDDNEAELDSDSPISLEGLPKGNGYILVPIKNVTKKSKRESGS